ncbi:helix-turn-helix domain-containing protein [Mesorhizobium loti]|uniref:AraC family transcriptional regulator n=1 Tax=Mesorhizobium loti R88b TaxID=935548 RepID=A0A6M7WMQ0_RHILI|nr:helix-turn-helix transcriptional regulator [Mesorhizobium loti]QKD05380.1 AraC family transcriptional regulator [Mesorhizobium loti R88b]
MGLNSHSEHKYQASSQLRAAIQLPNLRAEQRRLEAGHHTPGVRSSTELAFVIAGRAFAQQNTNGATGRYFIQPGIACILPKGVEESESANTSPLECLHIYLPDTLIAQSAIADYDIDPAKVELSYVGGLRDPKLYQIAMGFNDVLGRPAEPTDRLFLDGMQAALAGYLLGTYTIDRWRPPARSPEFDGKRLTRVLDYIETYLAAGETRLADLAAEACLSEFHFSRLFREATGLSPHRFVTLRRVQEAQKRLAHGKSSLVEIALETGFGSQANFIRVFRKATGLTPGQYRVLRRR